MRVISTFPSMVILATHARWLVLRADSVVHLDNGRVVMHGPPKVALEPGSFTACLFDAPVRLVAAGQHACREHAR